MPETETTVPERSPDTGQPGPPPGPPEGGGQGGFGSLAGAVYQTTDEWKRSAAKVREGLESKAKAMDPEIAATEAELRAPRPTPPAAPTLTQPPSRQLTEFLAPVEGESPVVSVTKLLQAIGLFATGASGAVKGDARAGLAAFTGAMQGWQAGDKERADRHFADWEAKTATALTKWRTERQTYQDIMEAANLSLEQRFKLLQLAAIREDNKAMADAAEKKDLETLLNFLGQRENAVAQLGLARDRILASRTQHEENLAEKRREADRRYDQQERHFTAKQNEDAGSFTPESLEFMAQQYYMTGQLPPMGMGKASTEARVKILNRAAELAKGAGTTAGDQVARTQFARATQGELTKLTTQRGLIMAFASTAEANLNAALELSDKVDRTGTPVLNRWILAGRRQVEGDADVTAFHIFTDRAITEIARLTSSATGGGVSTDSARREAAQLLSTADTKEQFRRAVESLHREVNFRREGYEKQIKATQDAVKGLGGGAPSKMPDAPPLAPRPGMIRVRRKSDKQTGWLERKDLSDLYEVVE